MNEDLQTIVALTITGGALIWLARRALDKLRPKDAGKSTCGDSSGCGQCEAVKPRPDWIPAPTNVERPAPGPLPGPR
jgi:hypothetical protein